MQHDQPSKELTIIVELDRGNALHTAERETIRQALALCGWNISAAARRLGVMRQSLKRKIDKLGLSTTPPAAP